MKIIWRAYTAGMSRSVENIKLILLLYLFNLITAYLISMPVSTMFSKALAGTTAAGILIQGFDLTYFRTVFAEYGSGIDLFRILFTFGLAFVVFNIFLGGGILGVATDRSEFKLRIFLGDCLTYVKQFFWLYLSVMLLVIIILVVLLFIRAAVGKLAADTVTEFWPVMINMLFLGILALMAAFIALITDYTRILILTEDPAKLTGHFRSALRFVLSHKTSIVLLYVLYLISFLAVLGVYFFVEARIDIQNFITLLIFIFWSQLFIILRIGLRFALQAGEYKYLYFTQRQAAAQIETRSAAADS